MNSQEILDMLNSGMSEQEILDSITKTVNEAFSSHKEATKREDAKREALKTAVEALYAYLRTYEPQIAESCAKLENLSDKDCDELASMIHDLAKLYIAGDKIMAEWSSKNPHDWFGDLFDRLF